MRCPLTRATFWEITAVPEIRCQKSALAEHLLPHPALDRPEIYRVRSHLRPGLST